MARNKGDHANFRTPSPSPSPPRSPSPPSRPSSPVNPPPASPESSEATPQASAQIEPKHDPSIKQNTIEEPSLENSPTKPSLPEKAVPNIHSTTTFPSHDSKI